MNDLNDFYTGLAAEVHAIADALAGLAGRGLAEAGVTLRFYPYGGDDATNIAAIDAVGLALLGEPGAPKAMDDGGYHHDVTGRRGPVEVQAFRRVGLRRGDHTPEAGR